MGVDDPLSGRHWMVVPVFAASCPNAETAKKQKHRANSTAFLMFRLLSFYDLAGCTLLSFPSHLARSGRVNCTMGQVGTERLEVTWAAEFWLPSLPKPCQRINRQR